MDDYYRRIEIRDFIEAYIWISAEQLGDLRYYVRDFTTILAKAIVAGNLLDLERG